MPGPGHEERVVTDGDRLQVRPHPFPMKTDVVGLDKHVQIWSIDAVDALDALENIFW